MSIAAIYNATVWHFSYGNMPANPQASQEMLGTVMSTWAMFGALLLIPKSVPDSAIEAMPYLIILSSLWTFLKPMFWCERAQIRVAVYGFGANPSTQATLLGLMCCYALQDATPITYAAVMLGGLAILSTRAAIGLAAYLVGVFIYFLPYSLVASPIVAVILTVKYFKDRSFFSMSGRRDIWKFAISESKPFWSPWRGLGPGTYRYMMPFIQAVKKVTLTTEGAFPLWAHNDLLQAVLELGVVGMILIAVIVGEAVGLSLSDKGALAFIACWLVNSLGNFNNHLAPDTLLTIFFLRKIHG